ncbi:hypothetical protein JXA47_08870 [Candidatus Sumerlaeota bacterium]|nr:hypothetical protein [Candidatus Sumerlaeota bacterium]
MPLTFEQRRRIVLIGFGGVLTLAAAMIVVCRHQVGQGLVWLFSESLGAVVLMMFITLVLAVRAKRRIAIMPNRTADPSGASQRPPMTAPPAARFLRMLVILLLLGAVALWIMRR